MLLTVGDLVQAADPDDEVVGLIIEMRDMIHRPPEARVMWPDMPGWLGWVPINSLRKVEEKEK